MFKRTNMIRVNIFKTILLFTLLLFSKSDLLGCNCTKVIDLSVRNIDGSNVKFRDIQPGDTVCIQAGQREILRLANIHGDSLNYITFKNCGGTVDIANDNLGYGISIYNCSYVRLSGSGDSTHRYGIRILKTQSTATHGLSIGNFSTDIEVDHLEICNTGFAGIMAQTYPTCDGSGNRGNFVQKNTSIHDNYIHNTRGEGMYIGHSSYNGIVKVCEEDSVTLYPPDLHGLYIYNNILDSCGYDGIQACCATKNCSIYNNIVTNYGTRNEPAQHTGIQIGAGTTGLCYNNIIMNGSGTGIMVFGLGDNYVFNNLICNAGKSYFPEDLTKKVYGIFCDDRATIQGKSFNFINNTIIKPKTDGIRIYSTESSNNLIYNNLIIEPDSLMYRYDMSSRFICAGSEIDAILATNYFVSKLPGNVVSDNLNQIYDYCNSLNIHGHGTNVSQHGINFDLYGNVRPESDSIDIGAIQFSSFSAMSQMKVNNQTTQSNYIKNKRPEINQASYLNEIDFMNDFKKKDITVYSLNGQIIHQRNQLSESFDQNTLPNGVYIVSVKTDNETHNQKIIVNKQ